MARGEGDDRRQDNWLAFHQLNGHEFEQTQRDSEGQESLTCCSPWDHKESDMTQRLNISKKVYQFDLCFQTAIFGFVDYLYSFPVCRFTDFFNYKNNYFLPFCFKVSLNLISLISKMATQVIDFTSLFF